jgi:hypothetical protein
VAAEPEHNEDRTEARPDALPIGLQIVGDHLLGGIAATIGSSKNSKANRIETGERSGGIGEICSVEVEEK